MTWRQPARTVSTAMASQRDRAANAFNLRMWGDEFSELAAAHRDENLEAPELERLALSAYMVGRDAECEEAWVHAHHAWLKAGDAEHAAQCAFWHALGLFFRGDLAPAMGWVARGGSLLEPSSGDSA